MVRVGAPDESGAPQLANPLELANGELAFPTSGSAELYPGMYVVYQLTEPGIYEYRMYVTQPQPDPDDPALNGVPDMTFADQLELDYLGSESDPPTQDNVIEYIETTNNLPDGLPGPSGRPRFASEPVSVP